MSDNPNKKNNIRVLRQKDVAEVVKDVLNNKLEVTQIESSLHHSYKILERNAYSEREAMKETLNSSLLLAKVVSGLTERVKSLEYEVQLLKLPTE